jgi:hypothetical protein
MRWTWDPPINALFVLPSIISLASRGRGTERSKGGGGMEGLGDVIPKGRRMKPMDRGSPWVCWRFRSRSDGSKTAMRGDEVGIPSCPCVSELQHGWICLRLVPILRFLLCLLGRAYLHVGLASANQCERNTYPWILYGPSGLSTMR